MSAFEVEGGRGFGETYAAGRHPGRKAFIEPHPAHLEIIETPLAAGAQSDEVSYRTGTKATTACS